MEAPNWMQGNTKWYLIGGVAGIAIIVFLRKRNSGGSSIGSTPITTANGGTGSPVTGSTISTGSQNSINGINDSLTQLMTSNQQLQGQLTTAQAGATQQYNDVSSQVTQLKSTVSQLQTTVMSTPYSAPVYTAPAPAAPSHDGWGTTQLYAASWAPGGGAYDYIANDYYGAGQGTGVNEVAAAVNSQFAGAHVTPDQISAWNGGNKFFAGGKQVYVGSLQGGVGH